MCPEEFGIATPEEETSQVDLETAFKSLGFNPEPLGAETDGKAVKPKRRPQTRGEAAVKGLGKEATGDPSPRAHAVAGVSCRYMHTLWYGFRLAFAFGTAVSPTQSSTSRRKMSKSLSLMLGQQVDVKVL